MKTLGRRSSWVVAMALLVAGCEQPFEQQELPSIKAEDLEHRSPFITLAGPNSPRYAYFGDLHIHTQLSVDSYTFGVRAGPDDAYRFA